MELSATTAEQVSVGGVLWGRPCTPGVTGLAAASPVTVQCTSDGQFVVVAARDVTWPHLEVDSISLLDMNEPSCGPADSTADFAIFQFPVTACGTTMSEVGGTFKMAAGVSVCSS